MKNFVRIKTINDERYMVTVTEKPSHQNGGTIYYIQTWRMDKLTSGVLHMPNVKTWDQPTERGYKVKSWDIDDTLMRFLEDFKKATK